MVVPWYDLGKPWLDHDYQSMVKPRYHDRFCRGTPILVNLDLSPEVFKWLSKSGSWINNHLLTYTLCRPMCLMVNARSDWKLVTFDLVI